MPNDPLSHVASWITPTASEAVANLSPSSAETNDPLIGLIRERDRLFRLADQVEKRARAIESTLPDDVRQKKVRISLLGVLEEEFSEKELNNFFAIFKLAIEVQRKCDPQGPRVTTSEEARLDHITERALVEFRAGLAKIHEAREASGCEALYREAEAIEERAYQIHDQVVETPAQSFDGLLWQLEFARDHLDFEGLTDTLIAGVKRLAGGACSLGLDELMKAERSPRSIEGGQS